MLGKITPVVNTVWNCEEHSLAPYENIERGLRGSASFSHAGSRSRELRAIRGSRRTAGKLALEIDDGQQRDIWVYDWARDTLTQLTFDSSQDSLPVWTPDGDRIVYSSDRATPGIGNLYWVNADGTGDVARLTEAPDVHLPSSWHPSGKFLAFTAIRGATGADLMILPMAADAARAWTPGAPTVFLSTPAHEMSPAISPDGGWVGYRSDEAGSNEVTCGHSRAGGCDARCRPTALRISGWRDRALHP